MVNFENTIENKHRNDIFFFCDLYSIVIIHLSKINKKDYYTFTGRTDNID